MQAAGDRETGLFVGIATRVPTSRFCFTIFDYLNTYHSSSFPSSLKTHLPLFLIPSHLKRFAGHELEQKRLAEHENKISRQQAQLEKKDTEKIMRQRSNSLRDIFAGSRKGRSRRNSLAESSVVEVEEPSMSVEELVNEGMSTVTCDYIFNGLVLCGFLRHAVAVFYPLNSISSIFVCLNSRFLTPFLFSLLLLYIVHIVF